ncbi:MAG: hypothetical protein GFH27_549309n106 [Chloroflexi bacterium AL-W]|nr:hypothetical protein [Chloroflexi bacterium AL-N1]NOK69808.1 hypothetical protein [Chloroflexi bacterium AL-N10]NOK73588.1 hypothetical protein [Chloroflexi bacterium AL-N5]NOK83978.1 hypothetical protein [Chloroflexi bacterium AL-W]NOK87919.1 hypothetical protein [Chloroflexi bacterium AL-N15]
MPNWNDVHWNWGAAEEAANTLIRIANELGELRQRRGEKATLVLEEADGPYRDTFSEGFDTKDLVSRGISFDCYRLANRINSLSEQAREEQNRRERERERWREEQQKKKEREHNRSEF